MQKQMLFSIIFIYLFLVFFNAQRLSAQTSGIDLSLSINAINVNPSAYSNFSVTASITNTGNISATEVAVKIPITNLNSIVYVGGNEGSATQGDFLPYVGEIWEIGTLAAGESATLTTNYFALNENPYVIFAQVFNVNENDLDSTPNNGMPPAPNEDDEAAISFHDSGAVCQLTTLISDIACNNASTLNDPTDDFFTFIITANDGNGSSGNWATIDQNGQIIETPFGESLELTFPIVDATGDILEVTVSADNCLSSNLSVLVPATCSDAMCEIALDTLNIVKNCFNNGTSGETNDDVWSFEIAPTGDGLSVNYMTRINGQTYTGSPYNVTTTFGLFNILDGPLLVEVYEPANPACNIKFTVMPPLHCSLGNPCLPTAQVFDFTCDNQNTADPADDTFGFTLIVDSDNPAEEYYLSGDLPSTFIGEYSVPVFFDNLLIADGEYTISITDEDMISCTYTLDIQSPTSCSVASALPDVALTMVSADEPGIYQVVSFEISATNTGNGVAENLMINVPLPVDAVLQGGNGFLATAGTISGYGVIDWQLNSLAVGQTEKLTVNYFTLSANPITCYAEVTGMSTADEDSTPNNGTPPSPNEDDEAVFTLGDEVMELPDLTATNLVINPPFSGTFNIGVDYPFSFHLQNIGNELAAGSFKIGVYLSGNTMIDNDDFLITELVRENLSANSTELIEAVFNIPVTIPSQFYHIFLQIDLLSEVTESDEDNNLNLLVPSTLLQNFDHPCSGIFSAETQEELNQFNQGCTTWGGPIYLEDDVFDLSPLQNLDTALYQFQVQNSNIDDLLPLSNLEYMGSLWLSSNNNLTSLEGLHPDLSTRLTGNYNVAILSNLNLENINNFPLLQDSTKVLIADNEKLDNLEGLSILNGYYAEIVVAQNDALTSLDVGCSV